MNAFTLLLAFLFSANALAQGTVIFNTRTSSRDARAYFPDGRFAGPGFVAGLYLVRNDGLFLVGTTPFRTIGGLIIPEIFQVPGIPNGSAATFRARVWDVSAGSYENAISQGKYHGEYPSIHGNNEITVVLSDLFLLEPKPWSYYPETDGFLPLTLTNIPEPSVFRVFAAGAAVLLGARRFLTQKAVGQITAPQCLILWKRPAFGLRKLLERSNLTDHREP